MKTFLQILAMLMSALFTSAQTTIDNEPGNNNYPGDPLSLPANNNAQLSNSSDVDIFKVNVTSNGVLVINLTGANNNLKARVEVINPNGTTSEGFKDANFVGANVTLELLTQTTGNYFVRIINTNVTTSSSPYNLGISLDLSDTYEYNNLISSLGSFSAIPLSYNESSPNVLQGRIFGYYRTNYSSSNTNAFSFLSPDNDIYKVTTGGKQGAITMKIENAPSNLKFRIEVIKADGITSEGFRDATVNGDTLRFELLTQYAGIFYIAVSNVNGNTNGNGNTSAQPYTLKLSLDTLGNENNNSISSLSSIAPISLSYDEGNPNILQGKIRGYYRTNYSSSNTNAFIFLSPDNDIYKVTTGGKQGAIIMKIENAPANLKFRIEVIKSDGITSEGFRDATVNGDTLRLELLTQYAGIFYLVLSDLNLNTSPKPYTLKLSLDTVLREFNDNANTSCKIQNNIPISGKIRGYYRTNYNASNTNAFSFLSLDVDYYKPDTCGTFQFAKISSSPSNLKLKITAYDFTGTNAIGSKVAFVNGDTVRINSGDLSGVAKYFKVEAVNSVSSPKPYNLFLGYKNCTYNGTEITSLFQNNFSFGPNPSSNEVIITSKEEPLNGVLKLVDIAGREVTIQYLDNVFRKVINISSYDEGVYFIEVYSENTLITRKLIIKHN